MGGWKESSLVDVVSNNGQYSINTKGWDSEALRIILNAIYNHTKTISNTILLKMLYKIIVLINYYKLYNTLNFFILI